MGTQGDTPKIGKLSRIDPPGPEIGWKGLESNPLTNTDPLIATTVPGDFLEGLSGHIPFQLSNFVL